MLEKRLKLFPVVGVLGARQTGKSTILRELLAELRTIRYVTLDRDENRDRAARSPTLFIENLESEGIKTVCIDEVQKAPVLFDTIKAEVDENKRPGRFAVSGSTEFSKKTGVNDSLTGRISLLRNYPLNISEITDTKKSKNYLKDISQWLNRGGMPGIFAIRDESGRESIFESWIQTTCTRDLAQFEIPRFNPELGRRILIAIAKLDSPTCIEIAKSIGKTSRQIRLYLEAFKALFTIYEIEPHKSSVGKSQFYLFDAGIAKTLGASEKTCLKIFYLNEVYSQFSYSGQRSPDIFFYLSSKGSAIDFIVEAKTEKWGVILTFDESPAAYGMRAAEAFTKKVKDIPVIFFAPCLSTHVVSEQIEIRPWSFVVGSYK